MQLGDYVVVEVVKAERDERVFKTAFPLRLSRNAYQPWNKLFLNANQTNRKIAW